MASNPITMKRDGSGSLAQKLALYLNPPPGPTVYGQAYDGLGDSNGNVNIGTVDNGIVVFSVTDSGVTVYDRDHHNGQSFGTWCANHNITGKEYQHLSDVVQSAEPNYLTACVPVIAQRCVLCSGPGGKLIVRGKSLLCRVGHEWLIERFTIPEIPPSIEAEVILTETKHDYGNVLSVYAERPSMRGSNEAGELVDYVEMGWVSPWPEDKHRAVVVGRMITSEDGSPGGAYDWENYILPTDEDGEKGAKFAGTVARPGWYPQSYDEEYLAGLDSIQTNVDNIADLDPTGGELIPPPTVGNPWRVGLYYKSGKLVMAKAGEAIGQGVSPDTQIPYSRLVQLGGYPLNRIYWPGSEPGLPDLSRVIYPDSSGEDKIGTLASSPTALDTYAYFFESVGNSDISQMPWREMRCTVKSGNGRASSSASVACVAFYAGYYWGDIEVKINGADPKFGVQIETLGNIVSISVPLDAYWSKSGTNKWSGGQTLNIVARWRGSDHFFPLVNAAFNDVPLPSVPDPASVDFDEFRQWDFGSPSQN